MVPVSAATMHNTKFSMDTSILVLHKRTHLRGVGQSVAKPSHMVMVTVFDETLYAEEKTSKKKNHVKKRFC